SQGDWSTNNGSTIASSTDVSQGSASMSVALVGYTEIGSIAFPAPGDATDEISLDMKFTASPSWGEARIVLVSPSQGHYWLDVGGVSLSGLSAGDFHPLSIP